MLEISSGKQSLILENPVIGGSGIFGFAGEYSKLIDLSVLGALVTNPITFKPRRPATGTRVVALEGGLLIHTGLPNPGANRAGRAYSAKWKHSTTPIIAHIATTTPDEVAQCARILEATEGIHALEIGLTDNATHRDAQLMIGAAREASSLPILARLPLYTCTTICAAAVDAGADALVVAAPPRGTARDPLTGQLIGGRLYGAWLKPLGIRAVGQIAESVKIPIIGAGGIHTPNDARDYIEAGASAVQIDTVAWIQPNMVEIIARNLGGLDQTRMAGALADEWVGSGQTSMIRVRLQGILPSPPPIAPPDQLPE
jgi:dihydroorotate dehydrogenase (NAD+) catalytic subunit